VPRAARHQANTDTAAFIRAVLLTPTGANVLVPAPNFARIALLNSPLSDGNGLFVCHDDPSARHNCERLHSLAGKLPHGPAEFRYGVTGRLLKLVQRYRTSGPVIIPVEKIEWDVSRIETN
jgi:hypothetical protein